MIINTINDEFNDNQKNPALKVESNNSPNETNNI